MDVFSAQNPSDTATSTRPLVVWTRLAASWHARPLRERKACVEAAATALREAWLHDQGIELTSAEFDLLWLLVANAGRILSREEIFTALRGIGYDGQDRSIDVRISRIRPKIGDDPDHPRLIKTIRSKGYLFVPEAAADMLL